MTLRQMLAYNLCANVEGHVPDAPWMKVFTKADVLDPNFRNTAPGYAGRIYFTAHAVDAFVDLVIAEERQAAVTRAGKTDAQ